MIYLENNNGTQQIFIPKNLNISINKTYDEGFQDGMNYQKEKLEDLNVTENGVYKSDNGYKQVNVEVANEDVCKLEELNITIVNDIEEYTATDYNLDGFSNVNVDASEFGRQKYNEGYEQGKSEGGEGGSCNISRLVEQIDVNEDGHIVRYAVDDGVDGWDYLDLDVNQYGDKKYNQGYEQGKSECGEGGSCNLDDLNVEWEPNWNSNVWYAENYGFDGYRAVSINAERALQEKYNEGYEQGKSEGGSCNIQNGSFEFEDISNGIFSQYAQDHGVDGWNYIEVDASNYGKQKYEEGKNETVQNLKPIKITSNGTYKPEKSYYLTMDSDDCFPLGTFGNRIAFEIKIDITEKSDERKYILGNWVNDTFQGIWCDNNIGFDWGKYYGAYVGIPNGIFTIKWWSDDDGNYSFRINDGGYGMATDGVDFNSIDLLLGALNNTCTNFNFYDLKIWNDSSSYLNGNEPDYVYSVGEAENAIYKNSEVVENIGDGAYAFKVEYQGSFGYSEVVVEIPNPTDYRFNLITVKCKEAGYIDVDRYYNPDKIDSQSILILDDSLGDDRNYFHIYVKKMNVFSYIIGSDIFGYKDEVYEVEMRNIEKIESNAMSNLTNLSKIVIKTKDIVPDLIIEADAFANCTNLNLIEIDTPIGNQTKINIDENAFRGCSENGTIRLTSNFDTNLLPYPLSNWVVEIIDNE